jgi:FkbM family methyltransferase
VLKKLVRDNEILNPIFRNLLKALCWVYKPLGGLVSRYRVYGIVDLNVCNIHFKIYSASDDHIANDIFYNKSYEDLEFRLIKELIKECRYFVDVGANTGIFSIYAAVANSGLKTFSFEPHPFNFNRLKKNISINNLSNVEAFPLAMGQSEKIIQFTIPADGGLAATSSANDEFTKHFHKIPYKKIDVKQLTLDLALSEVAITQKDLLKIDVEYYELDVLKGAIKTLTEKRPLLLIEILHYDSLVVQFPGMTDKINKNHANEIQDFLFGLGYSAYALERSGVQSIESVIDTPANRNFLFIYGKQKIGFFAFSDLNTLNNEALSINNLLTNNA